MHRPINCFLSDVVATYRILSSHWPQFSNEELGVLFKGSQQLLFLIPKKIKKEDEVWSLKKLVGKNVMGGTIRMLAKIIGIDTRGRIITNKTMYKIGISRMEEVGVPVEKGMRITCHRDAKSYAEYQANDSEVDDRVCLDVISGTSTLTTGKCLQYDDILQLERDKEKHRKVRPLMY